MKDMKVTTPAVGGICQSTQGRDKSRYYLIVGVNGDGTVLVSDGNFKRLAAPKKKNLKHLKLLPEIVESISQKLADGVKVYDTEIYSALKNYNYPQPADSGEI